MSKNDKRLGRTSPRHGKPGQALNRCRCRVAFEGAGLACEGTHAQAGEGKKRPTFGRKFGRHRFGVEQFAAHLAFFQKRFNCRRLGSGIVHGPLRPQAGMHQHGTLEAVQQRTGAQPVAQLLGVFGGEEFRQLGRVFARHSGQLGQKVQVVVAQHTNEAFPQLAFEFAGPPHHGQGMGSTVHEVAGQPQPVGPVIEVDPAQQSLEDVEPAMYVANDPGGQKGELQKKGRRTW